MDSITIKSPQNDIDMSFPEEIEPQPEKTEVVTQPEYSKLLSNFTEANQLVDDIVLKKYLHTLTDLDVVPIDESLKDIGSIRFFRITQMVYQNDEYSTYKFASVYNSVQSLNCGVFIIIDSDGQKTDFYLGVRSYDNRHTTKSLKNTLQNALKGQFPGVETADLMDSEAKAVLDNMAHKNIASVSGVANIKDTDFNDNSKFIQGLEKFAIAMQGQKYSVIVMAKSTPDEQLDEIRHAYETIYTQISPFTNVQLSYGSNVALSISEALSHGTTESTSHTSSSSTTSGTSHQEGTSDNHSVSKPDTLATVAKTLGTTALGVASVLTAPLTGGASLIAAGALAAGHVAVTAMPVKTTTDGTGTTTSDSVSNSTTQGESDGESHSVSSSVTNSRGSTEGSSKNMQLTMQNKSVIDTLQKIDLQLKRIDECESIGMWECGTYILSDTLETAEMAAGTYKAIMNGYDSGVETSAINLWTGADNKKLPLLRDYITNFIHPVFEYKTPGTIINVTPASLVSSNELAIQMGLPRKAVLGFPVIEHADFGKEVVSYSSGNGSRKISLGKIFNMGQVNPVKVKIDIDSLTMHTFVTGSTGSGKSNAIYELLQQLSELYEIPYLVIEPAKGEYKNVFGQFRDVTVYSTNPQISFLLKINPFRFPEGIHVLEHLDRLVEIFNVCWPMYAAMPAILKEAIENAYVAVGWDLSSSNNPKGNRYPNFADVLEQIQTVIADSKYSADSKGDYTGALVTRVRSLTNGLNGQIFTSTDDLSDTALFDQKVIIDLSRVGSTETKSLIMGLLVMKLNEYRMVSDLINSPLRHITVIEEAHNLLKRTSTEQTSEGANLLGKSVEMLSNSIAEMRTYGEGFVIADQAPGLLDMSVIRNTNTKIILRLPDQSDRQLVGYAAGLNNEQIEELAKLRKGVAAVYQNDWIEPVLVQINKCDIEEKKYIPRNDADQQADINAIRDQLIYFLIQGRVRKTLPFDIETIEQGIDALQLSARNSEFIEEMIAEYRQNGTLELWNDSNFRRLAVRITDILGAGGRIENFVINAADNKELTEMLDTYIANRFPAANVDVKVTLMQCFMKSMSVQQNNSALRTAIYKNWFNYMRKGERNEY